MTFLGHISIWILVIILMLSVGIIRYKGSVGPLIVTVLFFAIMIHGRKTPAFRHVDIRPITDCME